MHELARAMDAVEEMRAALEAEVVRAREQRTLIRKMDLDGLLDRASRRALFNERLAMLEQTLADELAAVAESHRLPAVDLDHFARALPAPTARLRERLAEVRALAGALLELDALNKLLAERSLTYVRGYLSALLPKSTAYDRRGAATAGPPVSTSSRVV